MRILLALALLLSGYSSGNQPTTTETAHARQDDESERLTSYLDAAYETELATSPERLTSQGRKEQHDKLNDRSEAALDRLLEWRRKSVADMKSMFDYNLLNDDAKTSYDIWARELDRAERGKAFRRHTYIFTAGADHTGLPQFLINFHRVDDKRDMEAYISRLSLLDDALDQLLVRARAAAADGIRPPAFAFAHVIDEVKRVTTGAPFTRGPDAALFADARAKIAALAKDSKITKAEATSLTDAASKALTRDVKPAYERVVVWLTADSKNASKDARGAGALPDGANYYKSALFLQTTTTMTAEEIHALGLAEVARLRAEMEAVKARVGFTGTLDEFFRFMRSDRQFYFPDTDQGRADYLALRGAVSRRHAEETAGVFRAATEGGVDRQTRGIVPRTTGRRAALCRRYARRLSSRHLLRAPVGHERDAQVPARGRRVPRRRARSSPPDLDRARAHRSAEVPHAVRLRCLRRRMGPVRGVSQQGDGVLHGSLFGLRTTCRRNLARGSPGGRYRFALEGVDRGTGGPVLSCEFATARAARFAQRSAATSSTPVRPPATRSA